MQGILVESCILILISSTFYSLYFDDVTVEILAEELKEKKLNHSPVISMVFFFL